MYVHRQLIFDGTVNVCSSVEELCDRIDRVEPRLHAFVPEHGRRERLRCAAKELSLRYAAGERPVLYGVPVGIKDIFRTDGFPTGAGSRLPESLFDGPEAASVSLLKRAGALVVGKTVTTEFAYFEPGLTRNPWNLDHTPGGSSSGSAAAVAAGLCALSAGTQTVGSVIRPAAFCGIVGYKPTFDRIPTGGLIFFSQSADHVGLFAADVAGIRLAASVVCTKWKATEVDRARRERDPVLGVPNGRYLDQASCEGRSGFRKQIARLRSSGYRIEHVDIFDDIEAINSRHKRMIAAEFAAVHHDWFRQYRELYRRKTTQLILEGQGIGPEELGRCRDGRLSLRTDIQAAMSRAGIDLWISPAAVGSAPHGIDSTGDPTMNLPWTHAGLPTVAIPAGLSANGLPLGLQLTSAFMDDERLLSWAEGVEETLGFVA